MGNGTRHAFAARAWLERLLRVVPAGGAVLDLGCGGGEPIARFLIDHGLVVTGVDLAQSQIELARTRFPRHTWLRADMRTVEPDRAFDAAIAWNSLTWLTREEQAAMAERAAGWLKPGGHLLLGIRADATSIRDDYRDGTPYRAGLEATDYGAMLARHGLVAVAHRADDPAGDGATVWLARRS